jgi:hypothetical protein
MKLTITRDELFYTVQAASQLLSWATDHHAMIFAHESGGYRGGPDEPSWLKHLHRPQEELSMALGEILPPEDPGSVGRGFIRAETKSQKVEPAVAEEVARDAMKALYFIAGWFDAGDFPGKVDQGFGAA